jgi:hypothetical protein
MWPARRSPDVITVWLHGGIGSVAIVGEDRVMPLLPRRRLPRAIRRLCNPVAILLTLAVALTSLPAVVLVGAYDPGPTPKANPVPISIAGVAQGPTAALDPPAIDRLGRIGRRAPIMASQASRVQPAPADPAPATAPAVTRWTGRYNLYRANAFVTQRTFQWCVAASVQMMVNIVDDRSDRSRATQARIIAYAQRWDSGPYGKDGGTDVTGWINALRHFGAGSYREVGATTAAGALRIAATAMAQTGRPAGILVMEGRHAWVLHGFESTTDPRRNRRANITAVRISGPLYPIQQKAGYDPRPNTRFSARRLARYFTPTSVGTKVGKYVVVVPTH